MPTVHMQLLVEIALETKQPSPPPRQDSATFFIKGEWGGERARAHALRIGGFAAQQGKKNFFMAFLGLQDFVFLFLQEWADLS